MISRRYYSRFSPLAWRIWLIDWLAVRCADVVLVESEAQRQYFVAKFGPSAKYRVLYTGADDSWFRPDPSIAKQPVFTVLFRGKFLPEAGAEYVIRAAKLLEGQGVEFLVLGLGYWQRQIKDLVDSLRPTNLTLITEHLPEEELSKRMLGCHVALGQLADHPRLARTIPHKAYEALSLGLPYLTARSAGIKEILTEGENCLMVNPADPKDLARAILELKVDPARANRLAVGGRCLFEEKFTPALLARQLLMISHED
jgi:glycosyltransferase involved in cell wall biosynthesis